MWEDFYIPALREATKYDRGTAYFLVEAFERVMQGIEALIDGDGKMRLLVGCTLGYNEIDVIRRGEDWKKQVESNLLKVPLKPESTKHSDALELLSWMIAYGYLEVRVAVRCDEHRQPYRGGSPIYHKKIGIIHDSEDGIALYGSGNETPSGLQHNSESFHVYTSWGAGDYYADVEEDFERDWTGGNDRLLVMDVPEAVRQKLLQYAPLEGTRPIRLIKWTNKPPKHVAVWNFIRNSHALEDSKMIGLTTAPVKSWPHQVQVFRRLHANYPAKLLIADEVGLGKTIQAGLYLRQAWLEGKRRILVMVPASLTRQWQIELREKLNLDWPIYDGTHLEWQQTHGNGGKRQEKVSDWTEHGPVIISSQTARRDNRRQDIINAKKWDLVVLDEAHYARRSCPNNPNRKTPNLMLLLMRQIKTRADGLLLLTATPMQLNAVELYDLLDLLGLPELWTYENFEKFYNDLKDISDATLPFLSGMFQASVDEYGDIDETRIHESKLRRSNVLKKLRGNKHVNLLHSDLNMLRTALLLSSPVTRLVSRNTRKALRGFIEKNNLDWKLGRRSVDDDFKYMSNAERKVYDQIEGYIRNVWNIHNDTSRKAVGFVLVSYRKRLSSSFAAFKQTLTNHLARMDGQLPKLETHEDEYDDLDYETDFGALEEDGLKNIDRAWVTRMQKAVDTLPPDTKLERLIDKINCLNGAGYNKVMVFTQFTDTMDYLRDKLKQNWNVACYSGRHGEKPSPSGGWTGTTREEIRKAFSEGRIDILLCTDAASEGLNFQFCGAMINYDMPWNPMRVEQRIGRLDRIGQQHDVIKIINLYYEGTVEADAYRRLRERIKLFEETVGALQPILELDKVIRDAVLGPDVVMDNITEPKSGDRAGVDLDSMLAASIDNFVPPVSPIMIDDLTCILDSGGLHPYKAERLNAGIHEIAQPTGSSLRVTTNRDTFEVHADSMEFWSPGSPSFPKMNINPKRPKHKTLKELLDASNIPK